MASARGVRQSPLGLPYAGFGEEGEALVLPLVLFLPEPVKPMSGQRTPTVPVDRDEPLRQRSEEGEAETMKKTPSRNWESRRAFRIPMHFALHLALCRVQGIRKASRCGVANPTSRDKVRRGQIQMADHRRVEPSTCARVAYGSGREIGIVASANP